MKTLSVDKLQIGLVMAISLIGGGAYHVRGIEARQQITEEQVRANVERYASMDHKLDRLLEMKTDIEVIKEQMKQIKRPVYQTSRVVDAMDAKLAKIDNFIGPFRSYYESPLTMSEQN